MASILFSALGSSLTRTLTVAGANDCAGVTASFSGCPPSTGSTVKTINPQILNAVLMVTILPPEGGNPAATGRSHNWPETAQSSTGRAHACTTLRSETTHRDGLGSRRSKGSRRDRRSPDLNPRRYEWDV